MLSDKIQQTPITKKLLLDFQPTIWGSSSACSWSSLFIIFIPLMLISILCIYN